MSQQIKMKPRDVMITPEQVFQDIQKAFKVDVKDAFDPCPFPQPEGFDGLNVAWSNLNYCNPPFSQSTMWANKAIRESQDHNAVTYLLLPFYVFYQHNTIWRYGILDDYTKTAQKSYTFKSPHGLPDAKITCVVVKVEPLEHLSERIRKRCRCCE